jgi:hypothetical protein
MSLFKKLVTTFTLFATSILSYPVTSDMAQFESDFFGEFFTDTSPFFPTSKLPGGISSCGLGK